MHPADTLLLQYKAGEERGISSDSAIWSFRNSFLCKDFSSNYCGQGLCRSPSLFGRNLKPGRTSQVGLQVISKDICAKISKGQLSGQVAHLLCMLYMEGTGEASPPGHHIMHAIAACTCRCTSQASKCVPAAKQAYDWSPPVISVPWPNKRGSVRWLTCTGRNWYSFSHMSQEVVLCGLEKLLMRGDRQNGACAILSELGVDVGELMVLRAAIHFSAHNRIDDVDPCRAHSPSI